MIGWRQTTWGNVCKLAYGKAIRGYQDSNGPFVVYGTNGPIGHWHEPLQTEPGVVIGRKGAYRGVHYAPNPFFVIDTAYALCPGPDLDARWAAYSLRVQDINSMDSGSAIPSTNRDEFYAIPVDVPPLPEQQAIAATLGALDDKIELNRRTCATLEAMARALFRSWFVDFDPVHAKAAGEAPAHMDPATAALFPDRFGEDELPEGWRAGVVADLVAFNPRETLRKDAPAPYLDMKALPTSGARVDRPITRPFTSGTKFRRGDVLLARITPCLENGKAALVDTVQPGAVAWGSTEFIVMRGKAGAAPGFVYCLVRHDDFRDCAVQSMVGSSGRQRVQQERLERFPLAIPSPRVLDAFSRATAPMFEMMTARGDEAETLATLRDTLLPKLMSGELRVREAERQVAEVA